jgi:acyl-homoserine lactone acylase PvdQ
VVWDTRLSEADRLRFPRCYDGVGAHAAVAGAQALAPVVARLRDWDRIADTASVETTWFVLAFERRMLNRQSAQPHVSALADALRLLDERWGTTEVPWGRLNRHQRPLPARRSYSTRRSQPSRGGAHGELGSVFTFASGPSGGGAAPRPRRQFLRQGHRVRADAARASILNYGQSGDPASPHFFDQAELYARQQFKPAWFSRAEVEANAVRSYPGAVRTCARP